MTNRSESKAERPDLLFGLCVPAPLRMLGRTFKDRRRRRSPAPHPSARVPRPLAALLANRRIPRHRPRAV